MKAGGAEIAYDALWLHDPDRLSLTWPNFGQTVVLVRSEPLQAPDFFPRRPGQAPYVYASPRVLGDGWKTAHAKDVGMDEAALTKLVQGIIDADPAALRPSLIHSLLIAHRGRLVLEEYFYGFDRDTPHDIRSAGKTFSSVLMGAAIRSGVAISPDSRIYKIMAGSFANPDPRKAEITLAQLMTHSAGLACDDNDSESPGEEGKMQSQTAQPDWWTYTLDLPMAHDPGSRYAYCSANINLVGGALTKTTGAWLPDYFDRMVARPLQFGPYYWNLMANGEGYLGGGAYLRPRDLLKLGQTYLDGGVWNGHRIVTPDWIKRSTAARIAISPATTGKTDDEFAKGYIAGADGLAWHLAELKTATRTYHAYGASGNGGQLLVVVPERDLAVVFTGGNYGQGGIWNKWRDKMIPEEIIPAIIQ